MTNNIQKPSVASKRTNTPNSEQHDNDAKEQLLRELLEQNRKLNDKVEKLEQNNKQEQPTAQKHDPDFYKRILIVVLVVMGVGLLVFFITKIQQQESTIYKQQKYDEYREQIRDITGY